MRKEKQIYTLSILKQKTQHICKRSTLERAVYTCTERPFVRSLHVDVLPCLSFRVKIRFYSTVSARMTFPESLHMWCDYGASNILLLLTSALVLSVKALNINRNPVIKMPLSFEVMQYQMQVVPENLYFIFVFISFCNRLHETTSLIVTLGFVLYGFVKSCIL